jgi:pyrroloquinoline quinone (PQQ) biosynthesis protein C
MTYVNDTVCALRGDPAFVDVCDHSMLRYLEGGDIDLARLRRVLQQYWHPIHHFVAFLASSIAASDDLHVRSRMSVILFQELGKGEEKAAHERLYVDAAERIGVDDVCDGEALPATVALLGEYRAAARSNPSAVGALFATELIDLRLVTCLGTAITRVGGRGGPSSRWQTIHQHQERDHVAAASEALAMVDGASHETVADHARRMWARWAAFLDGLEGEAR